MEAVVRGGQLEGRDGRGCCPQLLRWIARDRECPRLADCVEKVFE